MSFIVKTVPRKQLLSKFFEVWGNRIRVQENTSQLVYAALTQLGGRSGRFDWEHASNRGSFLDFLRRLWYRYVNQCSEFTMYVAVVYQTWTKRKGSFFLQGNLEDAKLDFAVSFYLAMKFLEDDFPSLHSFLELVFLDCTLEGGSLATLTSRDKDPEYLAFEAEFKRREIIFFEVLDFNLSFFSDSVRPGHVDVHRLELSLENLYFFFNECDPNDLSSFGIQQALEKIEEEKRRKKQLEEERVCSSSRKGPPADSVGLGVQDHATPRVLPFRTFQDSEQEENEESALTDLSVGRVDSSSCSAVSVSSVDLSAAVAAAAPRTAEPGDKEVEEEPPPPPLPVSERVLAMQSYRASSPKLKRSKQFELTKNGRKRGRPRKVLPVPGTSVPLPSSSTVLPSVIVQGDDGLFRVQGQKRKTKKPLRKVGKRDKEKAKEEDSHSFSFGRRGLESGLDFVSVSSSSPVSSAPVLSVPSSLPVTSLAAASPSSSPPAAATSSSFFSSSSCSVSFSFSDVPLSSSAPNLSFLERQQMAGREADSAVHRFPVYGSWIRERPRALDSIPSDTLTDLAAAAPDEHNTFLQTRDGNSLDLSTASSEDADVSGSLLGTPESRFRILSGWDGGDAGLSSPPWSSSDVAAAPDVSNWCSSPMTLLQSRLECSGEGVERGGEGTDRFMGSLGLPFSGKLDFYGFDVHLQDHHQLDVSPNFFARSPLRSVSCCSTALA